MWKNLSRNNKRTTSAEDTQNQHYQRVLTVVDSFSKPCGFEVHWHGGRSHTTSSWVTYQIAKWKTKQSRFSLKDEKSKSSRIFRAEIQKHEFQADNDRRCIQKLNETIESQKEELCRAHHGDERLRRDQQLHHEQLLEQNWDLREAHVKSLNEMEELKHFQGSTFDPFSRRKLIEDRDTILELTAKIQELQNEVDCMNDSRVFKDAESIRSGHSHVTNQPAFFPPFRDPGGMLSRSLGMLSRDDKPPDIWDTHGISGSVFVNPTASSSAPYPQESNPWISNVSEHTSPHVMSESQTPDTAFEMPVRTVSQKFIQPYRHEFQADYDRSLRKLGEIVESQREQLHCAQAEELQLPDQQLLPGQSLKQNLEYREAHQKSLSEMEELKKFQGSTFDTIARRRLVKDQDTTLELSGRIQDLQNEINCMND